MSSPANSKAPDVVFTVSRLNQEVNTTLVQQFGLLWVEGELSNFSRPGSGHFYFSLKDSRSQLRCAMFRGRNRYIDFQPEDGQKVLLRGKLGIYEARGDFQFIAEHMELSGTGALQLQFEQTKARLKAAGWFDAEHKQAVTPWPQALGLVTSPSGAAVRDILNVIKRRYPGVQVIIYPCQVQGAAAAPQICKAIELANRRTEVDTLIVARGGGSLEDLWAFNEEAVAAAIYHSNIPVISGVGHEVDFTIADMVADLRAPTPSAAAELAVPDRGTLLGSVQRLASNLQQAVRNQLHPAQTMLAQLLNRLQLRHPEHVINQQQLQIDELDARLTRALRALQAGYQTDLARLNSALLLASPAVTIERELATVSTAQLKLQNSMLALLERHRAALASSGRALDAVSPLATLSRGYAVVKVHDNIVTDASQVQAGEQVQATFAKGRLEATVTSINTD